jgi:hypothetical protein
MGKIGVIQRFDIRNSEVRYLVVRVPTDLNFSSPGDAITLNGETTIVRGVSNQGPYTYLVVDS